MVSAFTRSSGFAIDTEADGGQQPVAGELASIAAALGRADRRQVRLQIAQLAVASWSWSEYWSAKQGIPAEVEAVLDHPEQLSVAFFDGVMAAQVGRVGITRGCKNA